MTYPVKHFGKLLVDSVDPASISAMTVSIGDYAEQQRTFTSEDLKLFSTAIQDKYAAHKAGENAETFYRSDIVYGIFTSAMFTSIFRGAFPKAIYLSQELKFRKPILREEVVTGRVTVNGWDKDKKNVQFKTTITKMNKEGVEEVAVEGQAMLKIPYIQVV